MKKLIFPIILGLCFTNYIAAEGLNPNEYKYIQKKTNLEKIDVSMSQLIEYYLIKSSSLDLTDDQRDKLSNIPKKYIYSIAIIEAEFKLSRIKVAELMSNPNFNTDEVKLGITKSKESALETSLMSVDAIDEIRQIIGIENFKMILRPISIKKQET